jgi:hypothetical protein
MADGGGSLVVRGFVQPVLNGVKATVRSILQFVIGSIMSACKIIIDTAGEAFAPDPVITVPIVGAFTMLDICKYIAIYWVVTRGHLKWYEVALLGIFLWC